MAITRRDPLVELKHWEPFRSMERLQQEINHLFSQVMHDGHEQMSSLDFIPSAEMEETPDKIHLKLEIPGMEAKDLDVQVTETSVLVKGERKSESKTEEKGMVRSEFQYGNFERQITLPVHVQTDKVQADYKNGMLHLTLPKIESEQQQAVKVNIS